MSRQGVETEVKIVLPDAATGRRLLRRAGYSISVPRSFESNVVLDTPEFNLRTRGMVLRVRTFRREALLTLKGPTESEIYKRRAEIESKVQSGGNVLIVLQELGFLPQFRYEKYRTEYRKGSGAAVLLDETPIGVFFEIEGSPRSIDAAARTLGFTRVNYITASYGRLYLQARQQIPKLPQDMVFPFRSSRSR